jgi:multidrug efflux pump subunit AcrB
MFRPVFSATITTIIAFFGLVTIGGHFGDLISDIPFTVIAVLTASLVECFLVLPNHLSHAVVHAVRDHWYDWPSRQVNRGFSWFKRVLFRPFIAGVVRARYPVLALAVLLLANQAAQLIRGDVQWRFFSAPEQGQVSGNFAMLPGATRDDSMAMMRELQRAADAVAADYATRYGASPLATVVAEIGGNSGRGLSGTESKESWQLGSITIDLIDADLRPYTSSAFVADLQDAVVQHPLAETVSFRSWGSGPGGDGLDVQLFGADAATLKAAAEALKTELARFPEVSGLEDSLAYDKEEVILDLTAQGQALGFTIDGLGRTLRNALAGIEAATYPEGPRSATIRVELPPGGRIRAAGRYRDGQPAKRVFLGAARKRTYPGFGHRRAVRRRPRTRHRDQPQPDRRHHASHRKHLWHRHPAGGTARTGRAVPRRCPHRADPGAGGHLHRPGLDLRQLDAAACRHGNHSLRPCRHDLGS